MDRLIVKSSCFSVGISGATCSGKTTLSYLMGKFFYNSRVYRQDDFYYDEDDPRHVR